MSDPTKARAITYLLQRSNVTDVRRFLCQLVDYDAATAPSVYDREPADVE